MTTDARFEDGAPRALKLLGHSGEDVGVISSLLQDAVLPTSEFKWQAQKKRFAMLVNRFRWEEKTAKPERVRSVLLIDDVSKVASQGINRSNVEMVYAILALAWVPGADGDGQLTLTFAGDGALKFEVEAINITLQDVTRPYGAVSGKVPQHPE